MSSNHNVVAQEHQDARVYSIEKLVRAKRSNLGESVGVKVTLETSNSNQSGYSVYYVTEEQIKSDAFLATLPLNVEVAKAVISAQGYKAGLKSVLVLPGNASKVVLAGLGNVIDGVSTSTTAATVDDVRQTTHCVLESLRAQKPESVTFVEPTVPIAAFGKVGLGFGVGVKDKKADKDEQKPVTPVSAVSNPVEPATVSGVIARTAIASNHSFDKYLKDLFHVVPAFTFVSAKLTTAELHHNIASAEATLVARELGNDRADTVNPKTFKEFAIELATTHSDVFKIRVVEYDELLSLGFNLITAVGQSALHKPSVVCLEYCGSDDTPVALVGKSITFDTGGLHIKTPAGSMDTMYMDMCGGAAVFGTMYYLAQARPKIHVIGTLAIAENAIDALSYKPNNIYPTIAGFVQNGNCDAEGRLALADALVFTQQTYNPSKVVDIATLTGVQALCFGDGASAVFTNSAELREDIQRAGRGVAELHWPMPILPQHHADLKTAQADINSTGASRQAGASTAAAFIENFIQPGVEWAHIDVAGPASIAAPRGNIPRGATGFGVQTFIEYLLKQN